MLKLLNKYCAVLIGLLLLCAVMAQSATVYNRQTRNTPTITPKRECDTRQSCGWAIYSKFSRQIDYFVENTCTCNSSLRCLRKYDDISMSAYVYTCSDQTR